ncbi:MAG: transcription termination factor NusA [Deltaproteobacteria bacterium]|nr:transcription termination factor NusA [Deltaproteobacteria bacterium]
MLITDMKRVIEQVSRDRNIDFNVLVKALEEALRSAVKKKFGDRIDIEIQYNEDTGELEVFQFKDVVETIVDPDFEINIAQGRKLDPECVVGDSLGAKMDTTTFGRIAAQSAKQVIIQKLKAAERTSVYNNFIARKGEIINGIVQRATRTEVIVNLGQAEGVLPRKEQIPTENYRRGDRVRALIMKVEEEGRGPQVVLSRSHPDFLIRLFETEVPEINEGIVSIVISAREAGFRGKVAVRSNDMDIDPVGACVGVKGSRVQSVVNELRGEKIDIIPWHMDPAKFVCNALAPADIARVVIDEVNHTMEVIVPDDSLAVAIGKQGQNVRLASKMTGWRLDVIGETDYNKNLESGFSSLVSLPDMTEEQAKRLFDKGYFSISDLCRADPEEIAAELDIDEENASKYIEAAGLAVKEARQKPAQPEPVEEEQVKEDNSNKNDINEESPEKDPPESEPLDAKVLSGDNDSIDSTPAEDAAGDENEKNISDPGK